MKSKNARLFLFGGKGGVGKTTCSAAIAVKLASEGIKTLHITSDMAPSLSDIYGIKIGDRITEVAPELDAMEITQASIGAAWKKKFGPDFAEILSHILDMDGMRKEGDLDLLDYIGTAPSLREETLLDMIVEMACAGSYRRIIWDTAPAGETLNLLNMPRLMRKHLRGGARLYKAVDRLAGAVVRKRSLAAMMEKWVLRSEGIAEFLQCNTLFFVVANPEALVVRQTSRILSTLKSAGFDVHGLIINRVARSDGSDFLDRMERGQRPYMDQLFSMAGGLAVGRIDLSLEELRGIAPLMTLGEKLLEELGLFSSNVSDFTDTLR